MSEPSPPVAQARRGGLPAWLAPRAGGPDGEGAGSHASSTWLVETTLLVLAAVLLATATINDVARQVAINHRLVADERTWRHYTGHDYRNITIDQQTLGVGSQRELLCGNTSPGPPDARTQVCLAIWGATVNGLRGVHGGWYLRPYTLDLPSRRFGCFGAAGAGMCRR